MSFLSYTIGSGSATQIFFLTRDLKITGVLSITAFFKRLSKHTVRLHRWFHLSLDMFADLIRDMYDLPPPTTFEDGLELYFILIQVIEQYIMY